MNQEIIATIIEEMEHNAFIFRQNSKTANGSESKSSQAIANRFHACTLEKWSMMLRRELRASCE